MELSRRFFLRSLVGGVAAALSTKFVGDTILPVADKVLQIPTVHVDITGAVKSSVRTISEGLSLLPKTGGIVYVHPGVYANDYVLLPNDAKVVVRGNVDIMGSRFYSEKGRTDAMLHLEGSGNISIMNCCFIGNGEDAIFESPA